jgi:hypothetical protein
MKRLAGGAVRYWPASYEKAALRRRFLSLPSIFRIAVSARFCASDFGS